MGGNTDFLAAIQLILDVGIKHRLSANDMPNKLIVISDMQFDRATETVTSWCATSNNNYRLFNDILGHSKHSFIGKPSMSDETTHQKIQMAFYKAGLQVVVLHGLHQQLFIGMFVILVVSQCKVIHQIHRC